MCFSGKVTGHTGLGDVGLPDSVQMPSVPGISQERRALSVTARLGVCRASRAAKCCVILRLPCHICGHTMSSPHPGHPEESWPGLRWLFRDDHFLFEL